MKCSECPGLNRSYLACSHGIRHSYFIDEEIDCPVGKALLARRQEEEPACRPTLHARPVAACAQSW